jgi:hypothetical protein
VEGGGKERPTERVCKTPAQLDLIRSWAATWVLTGSDNNIPAKGRPQIALLSNLGPELTEMQIAASFGMFAKLVRAQNAPCGGVDHAATGSSSNSNTDAARHSPNATGYSVPTRKRGRPSKASMQAATGPATAGEQNNQLQALEDFAGLQQEREAEQHAEQYQSVKRITRVLRNAAARQGPVPADLHEHVPASSDEE